MPCSKTSKKASERKGSDAVAIVVFDALPFYLVGSLFFLNSRAGSATCQPVLRLVPPGSEETPCSAWIDGSVRCE